MYFLLIRDSKSNCCNSLFCNRRCFWWHAIVGAEAIAVILLLMLSMLKALRINIWAIFLCNHALWTSLIKVVHFAEIIAVAVHKRSTSCQESDVGVICPGENTWQAQTLTLLNYLICKTYKWICAAVSEYFFLSFLVFT